MKDYRSVSNLTFFNVLEKVHKTQERLHVIFHYPDHGDGEYTADPAYGQSMTWRLMIYGRGM